MGRQSALSSRASVRILALVAICGAGILTPGGALAQTPVPDAAPAKSLRVVVSFCSGGGYDLWARAVARHMPRFLAGNPSIVVQNMPGAGGLAATNYLYNQAPPDGTVMGLVAREAAFGPLTGAPGARFDATKFSWLGTPTTETSVCIVNSSAGARSIAEIGKRQLVFGDTGAGSGTYAYPRGLAGLLGLNFKFVSGFPSTSDIFLAMERNEVDGVCEGLDSIVSRRPDWIHSGKVAVLAQSSKEPNPEIRSTPTVYDLAPGEDARQAFAFLYASQDLGRPFILPPGIAPEKVATLRNAFAATMKDAAFVADATSQKLTVDPLDGGVLEGLVRRIYATPRDVIDKVSSIIK